MSEHTGIKVFVPCWYKNLQRECPPLEKEAGNPLPLLSAVTADAVPRKTATGCDTVTATVAVTPYVLPSKRQRAAQISSKIEDLLEKQAQPSGIVDYPDRSGNATLKSIYTHFSAQGLSNRQAKKMALKTYKNIKSLGSTRIITIRDGRTGKISNDLEILPARKGRVGRYDADKAAKDTKVSNVQSPMGLWTGDNTLIFSNPQNHTLRAGDSPTTPDIIVRRKKS